MFSLQDSNIPLFSAIKAKNLSIAEELLKHEREKQISFKTNPLKDTPLHLSARTQNNDMMKLMIQSGAGIDLQNV